MLFVFRMYISNQSQIYTSRCGSGWGGRIDLKNESFNELAQGFWPSFPSFSESTEAQWDSDYEYLV